MEFIKRQWTDIRGNVKFWVVTKFVTTCGGLITLVSLFMAYVASLPNAYLGILAFGVVCLIIQGVSLFYLGQLSESIVLIDEVGKPLNKVDAPLQEFRLRLIPHGKASSDLLLELINVGAPTNISAQIWIDGASQGLSFSGLRYEGLWPVSPTWKDLRAGRDRLSRTGRQRVGSNRAETLMIAHYISDSRTDGTAFMVLDGTQQQLVWDQEYDKDTDLPYFMLNVLFTSDEFHNTIQRRYKVGPETSLGPLRMVEVRA